MSKVYLVIKGVRYEGEFMMRAFSNREVADEYAELLRSHHDNPRDYSYYVDEVVVDDSL